MLNFVMVTLQDCTHADSVRVRCATYHEFQQTACLPVQLQSRAPGCPRPPPRCGNLAEHGPSPLAQTPPSCPAELKCDMGTKNYVNLHPEKK